MIYSGYFLVRGSAEDAHRRARLAAVMSILGVLDLPLVFMATRWFRGIHPVSRGMAPAMLVALLVSLASFSALFALLILIRKTQLQQARLLRTCESEIEMNAESDLSWSSPLMSLHFRTLRQAVIPEKLA